MAQGTYIKIYRRMLDWEWYEDTNCVRVFLHLLLRANWEDSEYKGTPVPRGSVATGRKALSEQLGLSEREIRTVLRRLAKCKSIDQQTTNKFSIISVCEFDTYNPPKDEDDQLDGMKRPAKRPEATTSKEVKKIKRNTKARPADKAEVISYCADLGLEEVDAEATWDKWEGNGWKNGKIAIRDWKATIRSWKANGYMPSQKNPALRNSAAKKPAANPDEPNCDEHRRKVIFKDSMGRFNEADFNRAWDQFGWVCDQNNETRTESRWTKYIQKKANQC